MSVRCSLGLDIGSRRVGVAVSDPGGTVAVGHGVVELPPPDAAAVDRAGNGSANDPDSHPDLLTRAVIALVDELDAGEIVVGLPLRTDGTEGPEAASVRGVAGRLGASTGVPVVFVDERFTTRIAHAAGRAAGVDARRRRKGVDRAAATLILQAHLDRRAAERRNAGSQVDDPEVSP